MMDQDRAAQSDRAIYVTLAATAVLFVVSAPVVYLRLPEASPVTAIWMSLLGSLLVCCAGLLLAGLVGEGRKALRDVSAKLPARDRGGEAEIPAGAGAA